MKPKLVIVLGPTAVGKSELALELGQRFHGEIVNADSQQVYRYMDIGTGKPSRGDRERVPHHVIDLVDPDQEFNAALFRRSAAQAIEEIHRCGKNIVVCGGTGLYLKALTRGLFTGPGPDPEIRRALEEVIHQDGLAKLYQRLVAIDASVTSSIHPNDRQRIIRALEIFEITGRPLSAWQKEHSFKEEPFEVVMLGLMRERAELYDRINRRSERMIQEGLPEEVRDLVTRGFGLDLKPLRSVGYRQMGAVIRGELDLTQALEKMKQETRRLAKRQLTWFRQDGEIRWYHPEEQKEDIFQAVAEFLL
ncbi:MAG TPA: tRNA (adenosine(37)-N6)-dimethylallyltransferase MiaA [Candidatus Binatia bacterium]